METFALKDACTFGSFNWVPFPLFFLASLLQKCRQGDTSCPSFSRTQLAPGPGETLSQRASSCPARCCPSRRAAADVRAAPRRRCWGPSELARVSAKKAAVWEAQAALTSPSSTGSSWEHRGSSVVFFPFFFSFFFPHLPVTTRTFHKLPPSPSLPL